jgi:hypothetical protein
MNTRFLLRGLVIALVMVAIGLLILYFALPFIFPGPPSGPIPAVPTIYSPAGELPVAQVGLQEWALYRNETIRCVGSGFFFKISDSSVIATTTAHSLEIGNKEKPLEVVAFKIPGEDQFSAELVKLHGEPGQARLFGQNLSKDYVLLQVEHRPEDELILVPDPRGNAQPGERVVLHSGHCGEESGARIFHGSVLTVDEHGIWVVMDDDINPATMSGSPVLSMHSGKVIGMTTAAAIQEGRILIGINPIINLMERAFQAQVFLRLKDYK